MFYITDKTEDELKMMSKNQIEAMKIFDKDVHCRLQAFIHAKKVGRIN